MLCLKSASSGINLWTSFAPKIQGWSLSHLYLISKLILDLYVFYDWDGALMRKTG